MLTELYAWSAETVSAVDGGRWMLSMSALAAAQARLSAKIIEKNTRNKIGGSAALEETVGLQAVANKRNKTGRLAWSLRARYRFDNAIRWAFTAQET